MAISNASQYFVSPLSGFIGIKPKKTKAMGFGTSLDFNFLSMLKGTGGIDHSIVSFYTSSKPGVSKVKFGGADDFYMENPDSLKMFDTKDNDGWTLKANWARVGGPSNVLFHKYESNPRNILIDPQFTDIRIP